MDFDWIKVKLLPSTIILLAVIVAFMYTISHWTKIQQTYYLCTGYYIPSNVSRSNQLSHECKMFVSLFEQVIMFLQVPYWMTYISTTFQINYSALFFQVLSKWNIALLIIVLTCFLLQVRCCYPKISHLFSFGVAPKVMKEDILLNEARKKVGTVEKWFAFGLYLDVPISSLRKLLVQNIDNESRTDIILKEWKNISKDQTLDKIKEALVNATGEGDGSGPGSATDADSVMMSSTPNLQCKKNTIPTTPIICIFLLTLRHHLIMMFKMIPIQWMILNCILVTVMLFVLAVVGLSFKIFDKYLMSSAIWSMVKVVTLISLLIFGHHLIIIFKIASEQWIIWAAIVALMLFVLVVINYLTSLQISTTITATEFVHELSNMNEMDWIIIGQALGISYSRLIEKYRNGISAGEYGHHVFKEWSTLEKPTWTKIVISLYACDMEEAGNEISSKHSVHITSKMIANAKLNYKNTELAQIILCPIGLTGEDGRRQTLSDLLEELKDVAGERCFDLGCQLNIPKDELNKIQHDKNSFLWKVDMLLIWMQPHTSTNSEVSWNYLARALKCIGMSLSKPASTLIREDLANLTEVAESQESHNITPTLQEMLRETNYVSKKLFEVGIHLDIPWETLQSIRMKERYLSYFRRGMLQKWSELEIPTWRKLVIALIKARTSESAAVKLAWKKKHTGMSLPKSVKDDLKEKLKDSPELALLEDIPTDPETQGEHATSSRDVDAVTTEHMPSKRMEASNMVTIQRLLEELMDVPKEKWFMFGCWLRLSPETLRDISTHNGGDDYRMMIMLCTWMESGEEIEWIVVVDAVRNIEMDDLAKKIANRYGVTLVQESTLVTHKEIDETTDSEVSYDHKEMHMDDAPNLRLLMEELSSVNKWFTLGLYLGVNPNNLWIISQQNRSSRACKREMFIKLLKQKVPTWTQVVFALLQMGLPNTAMKIAQNHRVKLPRKKFPEDNEEASCSDQTKSTHEKNIQAIHSEATLDSDMDDKGSVTLKELMAVLRDSLVEWYALGVALDIESHELDEIEIDYMGDISRCTLAMLIQWYERKKPTWEKLVKGLLKIGMISLAYTISRRFNVKLPPNTFDKSTIESELSRVEKLYKEALLKQVETHERETNTVIMSKEQKETNTIVVERHEKETNTEVVFVSRSSQDLLQQIIISDYRTQISVAVDKLCELEQVVQMLEQKQIAFVPGQPFTFSIEVLKQVPVKLEGHNATYCVTCKYTCHDSCIIKSDDKRGCSVMDGNGQCRACPLNCSWQMHRQNPYRYKIYKEEETRDLEELLRRYGIRKQGEFGVADIEYVIERIKHKAVQLQSTVASMIILAHHSLKDLQAIRDSVTVEEYIDFLMELEKKSQFANREMTYRNLKSQVSSQQRNMCTRQIVYKPSTNSVQNIESSTASWSRIIRQQAAPDSDENKGGYCTIS